MTNTYTADEREDLRSNLRVHLKGEELGLPPQEQIEILKKKRRKQNWFLAINAAAILFFGYSFYYGITQLGDTLLYVLFGVFVLNVLLIFYQKKKLRELVTFLKTVSGDG